MLHVGVVSHQFGSAQPTGVDRYGRELVTALAGRGDVDVTLCGPAEPAPPSSAGFAWVPAGISIRRVRGPRRAVIAGWWTIGHPRIDRACGPVDLVHVTLPLFPCPTRRPFVYTVHDLFPREHPEWYPRRDRIGFARALRSLERAAAIIAVSSWTADAVCALPWIDAARVVVVPEGVTARFREVPAAADLARACARYDVEPGAFDLFIGQVSKRKRLDIVIEAMSRATSARPLVIAGPAGDAAESVQALARQRGVAPLLRWAGFVPDGDMHALLHAARALVHPCPDEGFGLTPLEAMAAGTATVVADSGALPETVGDAALRCRPADPDAWAAALDALENTDTVRDLERRGTEWVRRYDWDVVAAQTVRVYRDALGRDG